MEERVYKKLWETRIWGKIWRMVNKMTESAKSAMMLDEEISKYFDIVQGVAQECTLSPTLFQIL